MELETKISPAAKGVNPYMYKRSKALKLIETSIINEINELDKNGNNTDELLLSLGALNSFRITLMEKYFA